MALSKGYKLKSAIDHLLASRRLVVLTGAGMSQESGIATFRDALTGWWSRFSPEELATEQAFRAHPGRVFGWYVARRRQALRALPHAGFHALVRLAKRFESLTIVTQNVDGLHRRAGSENVVELHGSLHEFRCLDGGHPTSLPTPLPDPRPHGGEGTVGEISPPDCAICGSPVRPGVVWFGEPLPPRAFERAVDAVNHCDALLAVGTSAVVYPAAELPHRALARRVPVIEINPEPTPLSPLATAWWEAKAGAALVELLRAISCQPSAISSEGSANVEACQTSLKADG